MGNWLEDNWEWSSENRGPLANYAEANLIDNITPLSIKLRRMPPITADPTMASDPFLAGRMAPIKKLLVMEFQVSSSLLEPYCSQSWKNSKNAKSPSNCGAFKLPLSL